MMSWLRNKGATKMEMPGSLEYYTADEVAECVSYEAHLPEGYEKGALYRKLWTFATYAENPTPLGGDGTNGTVETPDGRMDPLNDDKAPHWWDKLTEVEQLAISKADELNW